MEFLIKNKIGLSINKPIVEYHFDNLRTLQKTGLFYLIFTFAPVLCLNERPFYKIYARTK